MRGTRFLWTVAADVAFQTIKECLITAPILALPDFATVFELHYDACKYDIGVVLSQQGRPVAFYSEKIAGSRARYIALMTSSSMQSFRLYVIGSTICFIRIYPFYRP